MRASLVVSIHDVAPSTAWERGRGSTSSTRRHVPATLLVVPGPWEGPPLRLDRDLVAWLHERRERGNEIAQHGWTHRAVAGAPAWRRGSRRSRLGVAPSSGRSTPAERSGASSWAATLLHRAGFAPIGFTPPGWLASDATREVLAELGYRYTTTHGAVRDLATGETHRVPALSQRPGGAAEELGRRVPRQPARRLARRGASTRLALHPMDLDNPALVQSNLAAVERLLESGAKARTYEDFITAHRPTAGSRAA